MPIERFDHYNLNCADLERTRAFYCDVLGFTTGPRPPIDLPGYWLYLGGLPQIHLIERTSQAAALPTTSGALDHVAFRLTEPEAMIARLKAHGVVYRDRLFADVGIRQIVVHDPNGLKIELNVVV